jgi:tetratricopeptide (TPR) repeat protein
MGNEIKRKTAMVLYQIEESLGNFVLNNGNIESLNIESLDNIHRREVDKGKGFNRGSIKDIVEATYLDELFRFAMDIASDSSISDSLKYLYSLFHHLDIYEVRNAVSHPNRPFWDCYWYRVAAVASDPVNEILGLNEVKNALSAAEEGTITDPPEEWVKKIIWQIPNNLPKHFDHGLTGLIGRSKETQDLKKFIENQRVHTIALVAPGGAGKTALALDLLNIIVSTPSFTKYVDSVLYLTMKTEKLTSEGVMPLNSIETISELKRNITASINEIYDESHKDFEEVMEKHERDKILLCIDNLETLLRDNQNSFEELNHSLPHSWQVLVTSRVSIANATILSLEALKEKSAIHLARTYFAKRGGNQLEEKSYSDLTKSCFYNPLAIRLTLDLMIAGRDIPSSISVANKEIAEFSYNNLIDALSNDAIEILEAVFVEDCSTRLTLCELLEKTLDDISSAIGELSRTSLISRNSSDQGESYSLSDSVRDLLVISPRNIKARTNVQNKINKRRVLSKEIDIKQEKMELPIWHTDFIPKGTNENLKILVTEVNTNIGKARKNTDVAVKLFKRLKETQFIYENESLYHKAFGRVLEILNDFKGAEDHFNLAIKLNEQEPSSMYLLARLLHTVKRYDDAYVQYQKLIDAGWIKNNKDNEQFGKTIYDGLFLALLFNGRYDEILGLTKKWKDAGVYRGVLGTYRASAWKRKAEDTINNNPELTTDNLLKASKILTDVFRNEGYIKSACKQAINVFEEVQYSFSRDEYYINFPDQGKELLNFIADNILEISQIINTLDSVSLINKLSKIEIKINPFKSRLWKNLLKDYDIDEDIDEANTSLNGLISVKITNRPNNKASYVFARDGFHQDYFLHYNNFKNGGWKDWCQFYTGMILNIVADENGNESTKAINAKEIYLKI